MNLFLVEGAMTFALKGVMTCIKGCFFIKFITSLFVYDLLDDTLLLIARELFEI